MACTVTQISISALQVPNMINATHCEHSHDRLCDEQLVDQCSSVSPELVYKTDSQNTGVKHCNLS